MNVIDTLSTELKKLLTGNELYQNYFEQWQYLLESYVGGNEYRVAGHLTRYQLETDAEYRARLKTTPLENHCASVISVYNSFLFREEPERDFSQNGISFELEMFLRDADFDGRSLNMFMKDVATWASVFGHCWIIVSKPNVGAVTVADEQAQGIRPYVSLLTPMAVLDWTYSRQPNGRVELTYIRYLEETTGELSTVKEWTPTEIRTQVVNVKKDEVVEDITEVNQLGKIPAVCAYNGRSIIRGFGVSDITDIADAQKFIYNATSEVEQSIRLDSHPSLVKTPETQAGIGAGSMIHMPDNLDPGLKPYLLEFGGASIDSIYSAIQHSIDSIDKMANTGAVRATESKTMSGVAMETEFQLLNARLSEKADNLELAEEQMWQFWFQYMGQQWMGSVEYPGSFNIRDTGSEITQLQTAKNTATDPIVIRKIDEHILEWMGEEKELLAYQDINPIQGRTYPDGEAIPESLPPLYIDSQDPQVPEGQNCANCEYYKSSEGYCIKFDANVRPLFWCAKWEPSEE
jgi:hypothetical protein